MTIRFEPEHNRSAAYDGDLEVGEYCFSVSDNTWTIYHTEVTPSYGGRGIARRLVECVHEAAESDGVELVSTCSYAYRILGR